MKCPVCGHDTIARENSRSVEQLRRYFALIRAAYYHWPETHPEQFDDSEDLRKFLQMRAGHRELAAKIELDGLSKEQALFIAEAAIRATGAYAVPRIHGDVMVIFRPRSIAFQKLSHIDFCRLNDAVQDIILAETGIDPDQLLKDVQV